MEKLTKQLILNYLKNYNLMQIATYGKAHPWIASVYYSFDEQLNLYFLSDPTTLHCRQIEENENVAVAVTDSHQNTEGLKKGLQMYGVAQRVSGAKKIQHALGLWKTALNVTDPLFTYQNMMKKVLKGQMYSITPKKIKFFNQELFDVDDGKEPVMEM